MVNIEDFIKRLELILEYYALNASSFADKIGVQRSSLSHLLSGRNKPSLDFVLKILDVYPEVDLYWLLNGKGSFPTDLEIKRPTEVEPKTVPESIPNSLFDDEINENTIPVTNVNETNPMPLQNNNQDTEIEKIVLFYKNGTFKSYNP